MDFKSIIWLETSKKSSIDKKVIENLNLEGVYERLLTNDEILYSLCQDIDTIVFRQDILDDFMSCDGLIQDVVESLEIFYELKPLYYEKKYEMSKLYRIIDILVVMEKSVDALDNIRQILETYPIKSKGLLVLSNNIHDIWESTEYKNMRKDLKEIKYVFSSIKSAVLSVNMNVGLRPIFAQVTSVDDHKYKYPKAFRKVSDILKQNPEFLGQRLSSYVPVFKVQRLNYDLLEEIEFALEDHKGMLQKFIDTYHKIDIKPFIQLRDEIEFYKSSVYLFNRIKAIGLHITKPLIMEESNQDRSHELQKSFYYLDAKGIYNINLAMVYEDESILDDIILNDIQINQDRNAFVITGANRGGKTTFTQAIGHIQLFAQLGLFVPANHVELKLVDHIITHFPVGEKDTYETGKFGKECEIFVDGFKKASPNSLFLLNEAFTGTSHLESLNIATQGCLALLHNQIPFVFNTHLHGLYDELMGSPEVDVNRIVSLTTRMDQEVSMYKLIEQPPLGKSFARKIAFKYGITYEQLIGGDSDETRD